MPNVYIPFSKTFFSKSGQARKQAGVAECRKDSPIWLIAIKRVLLLYIVFTSSTGLAGEIDCDYNYGLGKLQIVSQAPAQSLRLNLPLLIPGDIKPGWGIDIHATWANVWASETTFLLDYEILNTVMAATYGINRRFGISVAFDNRNYFGGALDNFIQEFHDLFSIDLNGRGEVPKNRNVVQRFDPQTGDTVTFSASELNNSGVSLLLNYNITPGTQTWPSMNVLGIARYALKSADIFSNNHQICCGFGVSFAKRWSKRWYTYLSGGYTFFDDYEMRVMESDLEPLRFEDNQLTSLFALSWLYTPTFAILAQYLYSGPDIKNVDKLDSPSHEVHLGFRWRNQHYGMIEFALIENFIEYSNSPDFGLHVGWSYLLD